MLIVVANTLNGFANAAQTAVLFSVFGPKMTIWESFGLSNIGNAVSLFVPQGTALTKAAYMKHRYAIPLLTTPAIFLGRLVTYLAVVALFVTLTNLTALVNGYEVPHIMWLMAAAASTPVILFWFDIPDQWTNSLGRIGQRIRQITAGWKMLRSNRRCLLQVAIFQICAFITTGATISIAFSSIGTPIDIWTSMSIVVFLSLLNLFQITPGNLGIQEAGLGFFSQLYGFFFMQGVIVSGLTRAISLLITVCVAPIAWYFLFFSKNYPLR